MKAKLLPRITEAMLYLLAAFVLKNFADQRDILLKSPFFMVLNGIKAEVGKKLASIS